MAASPIRRFRSLDRITSRLDLSALLAFLRGEGDLPPEPKRSMLVPDLGVYWRSLMGKFKRTR